MTTRNAATKPATAPAERITRVTAEEAARMPSRTDWARVHATTPAEVDAQAEADAAEDGMVVDWDSVTFNRPSGR